MLTNTFLLLLIVLLCASANSQIAWYKCDAFANGNWMGVEPPHYALCGSVQMKYNSSSETYITLAMKKYVATVAKGTVLVIGDAIVGIGGNSTESVGATLYNSLNREYDIIMPDFRGAGSSSPLLCDEVTTYDNIMTNTPHTCINEWKKKYGGDLSSFNVDEVAKDFIYLSKNVQTPVIALGRGFGSYVVHRMLQIDSSSIDAVLMDGVCVGTYCNASNWDVTRDSMLLHMVSQIGTVDTQSIAYQEYKPYQFDVLGLYKTLLARMPKKEICRVYYQYIKGYKQVPPMSTFMLSDPTLRPAFLASILFLNRCNMNEYGEAAQWFNPANNPGASRVDQYFKRAYPSGSSFLATHIIMSELTDSVTVNNSLLFTGNLQKSIYALKDWPRYASSSYRSTFAEFNKPMLLLHGEYDYQSSVSDVQTFASRYNTSTLVVMPGMMSNSIMKSYQRNSSITCGLYLATQFIKCPNCTLNKNCSSIGLSFSGDAITTKLYGNVFQPQFYPSYYGLAVPIVFGVFLIVPITFFVLLLFFHKDRRVKARLIGPYIGQVYAFIYLSNDLIGAGSYGTPDILAISVSACFLLTVCATIMVLQLVRYFAMSITYHLLAKRTPSGRGLKILSSRWLFAIVVTVSAIGWFASGAIVIGVSYAEPSTLDDVYSNWLLASRMFSVILAVLAVICGFIELILHAIRTKCNIIEYFKDPLLFRIDNFILIPIIFFAVVLASGVPTIDGVFYTIFELGLFLGVCFYFGGTVSIVCLIDFFKSFKRDTARDSIALEQGLDLSPESTAIKKLRRMLTDEKSNAIFSQYCKREWSLENLLAYNDVTALVGNLETLSGIEVQTHAQAIFDLYLAPTSQREVNVPGDISKAFSSMIQENTFKKEVLLDLERVLLDNLLDTFSRFRHTRDAAKIEQALKIKRKLEKALETNQV